MQVGSWIAALMIAVGFFIRWSDRLGAAARVQRWTDDAQAAPPSVRPALMALPAIGHGLQRIVAHLWLAAGALALALTLGGCTVANQRVADQARTQMVGMSKPAVLGCMGAPLSRAAEGPVEAWTYSATGNTSAVAAPVGGGFAAIGRQGRCAINVIFDGPAVSRVTYNASGSGFAVPEESCAPAVRNCVP